MLIGRTVACSVVACTNSLHDRRFMSYCSLSRLGRGKTAKYVVKYEKYWWAKRAERCLSLQGENRRNRERPRTSENQASIYSEERDKVPPPPPTQRTFFWEHVSLRSPALQLDLALEVEFWRGERIRKRRLFKTWDTNPRFPLLRLPLVRSNDNVPLPHPDSVYRRSTITSPTLRNIGFRENTRQVPVERVPRPPANLCVLFI